MKNINDLVYESFYNIVLENYTPTELEENSMSNQKGNMIIFEDNDDIKLIFEVNKEFSHSDYLEFTFPLINLNELNKGEEIIGVLEGPKNLKFEDFKKERTTYVGGGSLTYENGIDFIFKMNTCDDRYNLLEPNGMPGSRIRLIKL